MSRLTIRYNPKVRFEADLTEDDGSLVMVMNWYHDPEAHGGDLFMRVVDDGFPSRAMFTNEQMDYLCRDWLRFRGHTAELDGG